MAHKRRRKKITHRRRSRMSGLGGIDAMQIIGVIGGAFVGKFINKVIPDSVNPKIVAGGKVALGIILPIVVKGKAKNMMKAVGDGILAVGSIELLTEFGVISGLGLDDNTELAVAIEGIEDVSFEDISGNVLAGDDIPVINADVLSADDIPVINGSWSE